MKAARLILGVALLGAPVAGASDVEIFKMSSQESFLRGTLDGMSVDALGTLRLAPKAERLAAVSEPFVFAAAPHPRGWVVGTGNAGKVLLVTREGGVEELFATEEPEVFAVWAADDGTVYAGSSPEGKVYRFRDGEREVFFDPEETYVWQLAPTPDGDLLVATGGAGRLYRVDGVGKGRRIWESGDTHVRSLAVRANGTILAGTAGEGRIVAIDGDRVRTIYDAAPPEVVAMTAAPDGSVFAAVLASEASGTPAPAAGKEKGEEDEEGEVTVVVSVEGESGGPVGSRPPGYKGPRSEIVRIAPGDTVSTVARLEDETVFALGWSGGRLWVGTGLEGKLYSWERDELVLQNDVEDRQIVALAGGRDLPAFATTNAGAFYRLVADGRRTGTYVSPVLDAKQVARFGTFRWLGEAPDGTTLRFAFRSGLAAEPDATWSSWSPWREGREVALDIPGARYVQWKVEASGRPESSPALAGVELSYRQENLAPQITAFEAMDPGQVIVDFNFNPGNQVYEPAHPTRDGMFTTLKSGGEEPDRRTKVLWKKGFRTLRWKAEDPNDDALVFRLDFRPEGGAEWLAVAEDLADAWYAFDAEALPDGIYRFQLTASDREEASAGDRLTDVHVSEPVTVDHTPPRLVSARREGRDLIVEIEDALNPVREASASAGATGWVPAEAVDGLVDGRRETLRVPVPAGEVRMLVLRVSDAAFNGITYDLSRYLR